MATRRTSKAAPSKSGGGGGRSVAKGSGTFRESVVEGGATKDSLTDETVHLKSSRAGASSKDAEFTEVSGIREETYIGMQSRGVVALPAGVRKRHGLDRPGAQMRMVEREDGVIELHPQVPVPASQAWFWDARWQKMEAEAEADIAEGRVTRHESLEDLMGHIASIGDAD